MRTLLLLIIAIISFGTNAQDFNWALQFAEITSGTQHEQYINGFKKTADSGLVVFGFFEDDVDFDPTASVNIVNTGSIGDGFIVKLDSLGNLEWVHALYGNIGSEIHDVAIDDSGNIYATGYCRGFTFFNLATSYGFGAGSDRDIFVMKLKGDGTFQWAEAYGDPSTEDFGYRIECEQDKLFVGGRFEGTMNVDPNFTNTTLNAPSQRNVLICMDTTTMYNWSYLGYGNGYHGMVLGLNEGNVFFGYNEGQHFRLKKFDLAGSLLMDLDWGNLSDLDVEGIAFDHDGGIYLSGCGDAELPGTYYDLDPGPNEYIVPVGIFYLRLDEFGSFYDAVWLGGFEWNQFIVSSARSIDVDYQKNVYISGSFRQTVDFDPSPNNVVPLFADNFNMDAFVARYDSLGNYIWAYDLGNNRMDYSTTVFVDSNLNVISAGAFTCTVDFDPSLTGTFNMSETGCGDWNSDCYIQSIQQDSCDHLGVIIDTLAGINCSTAGYVACYGTNSVGPYLYSWDGGPYVSTTNYAPSTPGTHNVTVLAGNGCLAQRSFHVGGPITSQIDVEVNAVLRAFIPGQSSYVTIDGFNHGCTAASGEIKFVRPDLMNIDSISVTPDVVNGDTLIWYFTNYDYQTPHFIADIYYTVDTTATIGDSLCFPLTMSPLVDENPPNNNRFYCPAVVNSYDPNNKLVYPAGVCIPNYIDTTERLTYTVNFQNTGTSEAVNVYILDYIDTNLDLSTLQIVGNTHYVETELLPNNLVKFRFDDIHLADSVTNEPMSKGYIIFELQQNDTVPNNTAIDNQASIYFDYNAPIHTNSVLSTVVDVIPSGNAVNIQQTICDSALINGITYNTTGNYLLELSNSFGCDSLVNLDLTVLQSSSSILNEIACDSIEVGGQYFDSTGIYSMVISNAVGCDSSIQLELVVLDLDTTLVHDSCDMVSVNGITYDSTGIYTQVLASVFGCDSILTLDITVTNNSFSIDSIVTCDSLIWMDGNTYTISTNTPTWSLVNAAGCDSIITLDLTLNYSTSSIIVDTALDVYTLNGQDYTLSGVYTQVLTNAAGCDSTITLDLTVHYTGIEELDSDGISIYPNPTHETIKIIWTDAFEVDHMCIIDNKGVLVRELDIEAVEHDLRQLVNGIYYVKIETTSGVSFRKLVKM